MKLATAVLIAASAAILAGCAAGYQGWYQGVRPYWTLHEQDFAPVTPGTTKANVNSLVGKPLLTTEFPRQGEEVWDYRFLNGVRPYIASVYFDMQGRTKYYTMHPDRCPMSPAGCY